MNSVNLVGRLTRDPELRSIESQSDRPVCHLRVAVNGNREGQTTYVDVSTFDASARACAAHLRKGRQVAVEGRLVYREWQAEDGTKRSRHSVIGRVHFLGASRNGDSSSRSEGAPPAQASSTSEDAGEEDIAF